MAAPRIEPALAAKRYRGRPSRSGKGRASAKIEVRLTIEEKTGIQQRARRHRVSVSGLARRLMLELPIPEPIRERPAATDLTTAHHLGEIRRALAHAVMLALVSTKRHGACSPAVQQLLARQADATWIEIDRLIHRLLTGRTHG